MNYYVMQGVFTRGQTKPILTLELVRSVPAVIVAITTPGLADAQMGNGTGEKAVTWAFGFQLTA